MIDHFLLDIIPVEIVAKFGNAIDDDDELGKNFLSRVCHRDIFFLSQGTALNGFFNENSQEIFKMTKPKITEALCKVFTKFANQILMQFPTSSILPS